VAQRHLLKYVLALLDMCLLYVRYDSVVGILVPIDVIAVEIALVSMGSKNSDKFIEVTAREFVAFPATPIDLSFESLVAQENLSGVASLCLHLRCRFNL